MNVGSVNNCVQRPGLAAGWVFVALSALHDDLTKGTKF